MTSNVTQIELCVLIHLLVLIHNIIMIMNFFFSSFRWGGMCPFLPHPPSPASLADDHEKNIEIA